MDGQTDGQREGGREEYRERRMREYYVNGQGNIMYILTRHQVEGLHVSNTHVGDN